MRGKPNNRGVAQLASASGLGPEGPVFESQYPDIIQKQLSEIQVVAFFLLCILLYTSKISNFDTIYGSYDTGKRY